MLVHDVELDAVRLERLLDELLVVRLDVRLFGRDQARLAAEVRAAAPEALPGLLARRLLKIRRWRPLS